MKNVWMGIAACTLILSSCNNDEINNGSPEDKLGNRIAFNTGVGAQTRAAEMELPGLKAASVNERIAVKLYKAESHERYGVATPDLYLQWSGGRWDVWNNQTGGQIINSIEYNGAADFYSYYPTVGTFDVVDGTGSIARGTGTLDYTVEAPAKQIDLLIADKVAGQSAGVVTLAYQHALSQINFALKDDPKYIYYISSIKVVNANNRATWIFGDRASAGWEDCVGAADYLYPIEKSRGYLNSQITNDNLTNVGSVDYKNLNNGFSMDDPEKSAMDATYRRSCYQNGTNGLMLMPQNLQRNIQCMEIVVDKVTDLNGNTVTVSGDALKDKTFYVDFFVPNPDQAYNNEWKKGLRYLYVLDMGAITGITNYISFNVIVTEWENFDYTTSGIGDGTGQVDITSVTPLSIPNISLIPNANILPLNGIINYKTVIGWEFLSFPQLEANSIGSYIGFDFTNVQFVASGLDITINVPAGYAIGCGINASDAVTNASGQTLIYTRDDKVKDKKVVVVIVKKS